VQHDRVPGQQRLPLLREPVAHRVLAGRRKEAAGHSFGLDPQHQHRVGDGQFGVEVMRHGHRPTGHSDGKQRRGRHQNHLGTQGVQQQNVGPGNPAVQDVSDDHHPLALDPAETLPDGQRVEQRLGWMFVGSVARVDHRRAAAIVGGSPLGELLRST
jgi:hypothetical protein